MSDFEDEGEKTIADDFVVTKYKMAGDMANQILKDLIQRCTSGTSVRELCILGDQLIVEKTNCVFKKEKELTKGIGFPTCISVNNCIGHFSPLLSEPDLILSDGDLVKVDLGVHIDGFIACAGHTVVVGATNDNKITGRKADVLLAAYYASEIALRLVKAGNTSTQVRDAIEKVAGEFECSSVEGMCSVTQLQQNTIEGEKSTIVSPSDAQKKDDKEHEYATHDVYTIDIVMSSGDGKWREGEARTTVYKRTDEIYALKMKTSRTFYSEVCNKFTTMPFTLRALEDEKKARLGVGECTNHELLMPYPVRYEKDGEFVARFEFTVLLMPNGPLRITHGAWQPELINSEYTIKDEELKTILSSQVSKKTQKKKKKKTAAVSEPVQEEETMQNVEQGVGDLDVAQDIETS